MLPSVNPDRVDQHEIVAEMQRVDFDRRWSADRSAAMKSASRAADIATNLCEAADFENPGSGGAGTSLSGSRTARPNRRVDTLISIRLIAQRRASPPAPPVPARDRQLAAVHIPDPRALDLDLAAVEADLSPRSARTVRPPRRVATVARRAGRRDIRLHHRAERLVPAARQDWSKLARTSANASSTSLGRQRTSRSDISRLGVALVCGISTPSLPAQGGQRRPLQKINRTRHNLPSSNTE
ncbi:hypothetical protein ABIB00_007622 [Bradyrhizobium sp. LB14.3]